MFTRRTLALAAALTLAHSAAAAQRPAAAQRERLAPPASVTCPRDDLTVYFGRVVAYRRGPTSVFLRVRTDYDTTEEVTVRHRRGANPARWFLLEAEPFRAADWGRIESRRGRLRPGVRANVWVCSDGSNPIVDWRPAAR